MQQKPIRTLDSRIVYQNKWSRVREDSIERSNGQRGIYGVLDKDPACIIIPLEHTPQGDFLTLVHQYRYTVEGSYYEFPQGGWEQGEDVDIEALARGELREETGLRAGKMTRLAANWIAYGAMRQRHHVWLAEELTQGEAELEAEEDGLTVHRVNVDEFEQMIFDGRVEDNCTLAAWATYLVWKRRG
ncbi:NUDIX hydrolase [Terriglobus sp. ADX1]|uniref:NUDIX hydrolase n=1 Tax=Terriglobus sp. ADX1 TaxID=2794063 RepID=UPI002FE6C42B